jgi:flagellin-specific chaperone FliS
MRTKSGKREMNPVRTSWALWHFPVEVLYIVIIIYLFQADAQRKLERKKEVSRNKMERKYIREAGSKRDRPEDIKKELQEMLDLEEAGPLNKMQRLHKKVLQEAYDHALKKKMVRT